MVAVGLGESAAVCLTFFFTAPPAGEDAAGPGIEVHTHHRRFITHQPVYYC